MSDKNTSPEQGMQATDYKIADDTLMWWSTPIWHKAWPKVTEMNSALKVLIYKHEQSDKSLSRSNEGGWHSQEDFLLWGGQAVAHLQQRMMYGFQELTKAMTGGTLYNGRAILNAWVNVNRDGDYNSVHTHPGCVWSGVYYVEAGDPVHEKYSKSGVIEFVDPRAGAEMMAAPGLPFAQNITKRPKTGDMIMFPSWLKHFVHPYRGTGERISIAFNIRVRPKL